MGKRLYYCGGAGLGLHAKLTQNLILSNILQAFNEGMVLAAKAGVEPASCWISWRTARREVGSDFVQSSVRLPPRLHHQLLHKWMHKDVGLMLDSGKELAYPWL